MSVDLRLGKKWGLRRMATPAGHFTMVAMDQRPPITSIISKKRGIGVDDVQFSDMVAVKRVLVQELGEHASAMLFDPNFSFPAALEKLPARTGLMVTLEDHRFEDAPGGRKSHSIRDWSVEKIKHAGGDGVKVLAWYRPDAAPEVLTHQKRYVENIGEECRRHDIAMVLELLVYPFPKSARHTIDYVESPEKMPELVLGSVREFAHPRYGVDLLKLESPLPGAALAARDGGSAHIQTQRWFDEMGGICRDAGIPWVMLSAGVTSSQFLRVMEYAYAAGANGFLAGRAIWWNALQHFPDIEKFAAQLRQEGCATLRELDVLTKQAGNPWRADYSSFDSLKAEGDLCAAYA